MKCKICGRRFTPTKEMSYMVSEQLGLTESLTKAPRVFDAVDCPKCGCQMLLGVRMAPFKPNCVAINDCDD